MATLDAEYNNVPNKFPNEATERIREEIKLRKQAELELTQLREEMKVYKEDTEKWKKTTLNKYEEAIKKMKAKNYEYVLQVEEWKRNKEKEVADQQAKINENNELIAKKVEELKQWKLSQGSNIQEILNTKEKEIKELREALNDARGRIRKIELEFPTAQMLEAFPSEEGEMGTKKGIIRTARRHTISFENLNKMQDEILRRSQSPELISKADRLQMEIATLVLRQEKMNLLIMQGEEAKKNLVEVSKELARKRKDLNDVMKDMKSARIVKSKQRQKEEELENKKSIIRDPARRKTLLRRIPKLIVAPLLSTLETGVLIGPAENGLPVSNIVCCGWSASLYPFIKEEGKHQGDPIADRFSVKTFKDCTVVALADGCGWGCDARDAAKIACAKFVDSMTKVKSEIVSTNQATRFMLRAFLDAHNEIIAGRTEETLFLAGTTTMLGGIVLELEAPSKEGKYAFVCTSIGDCKAFLYSYKSGFVKDITSGNRQNINDVRDPGGRLGPQLEHGEPDLRNILTFSCICDDRDLILIMSDGIHDNLDPEYFGKTPKDYNLSSKDNTWSTVEDEAAAEKAKITYSLHLLKNLVEKGLTSGGDKPIPQRITEGMVNHALQTTFKSRDFMENNRQEQKLPNDHTTYPGKMDHATCVTIQVGTFARDNKQKLAKSDSFKRLSV